MSACCVIFILLSLVLVGLLLFVKFTKRGQGWVCPVCEIPPPRIGMKYKKTNDSIVNSAIDLIDANMDAIQNTYLKCDSAKTKIDLPEVGSKCADVRALIDSNFVSTGVAEIDNAQTKLGDTIMKNICRADGTLDHDKMAASSAALQKTFCV